VVQKSARAADDFDAAVEKTEEALIAFVQGDSGPIKEMFSTRDDVILANPLGPPYRGRQAVEEGTDRAVAFFRDGTCEFEDVARYATGDLGYLFHIERAQLRVGDDHDLRRVTLRVTMVYRREDDGWKIVHRQADPIMNPRPVESIFEP
jgi:ketosteroid isomerase-like protein